MLPMRLPLGEGAEGIFRPMSSEAGAAIAAAGAMSPDDADMAAAVGPDVSMLLRMNTALLLCLLLYQLGFCMCRGEGGCGCGSSSASCAPAKC